MDGKKILDFTTKLHTGNITIDPEKIKEGRKIIDSIMRDPVEIELAKLETNPEEALNNLLYLLEDIDHTTSFYKRKGYEKIRNYLDTEYDELIYGIIKVSSQNYSEIQNYLKEWIPLLLKGGKSYSVRTLIVLLGTNKKNIEYFIECNGWNTILALVQNDEKNKYYVIQYLKMVVENDILDQKYHFICKDTLEKLLK